MCYNIEERNKPGLPRAERQAFFIMEYTFVRGPFMLMETAAMVFKYVNHLSFNSVLYKLKLRSGGNVSEKRVRVLKRLQEITDQVCGDLDREDPALRRYFAQTTADSRDMCVALAMIVSFCTLDYPNLRDNARAICNRWHQIQERGCWLGSQPYSFLTLMEGPGSPGDLFDQICAMDLPTDFQMKLYGALRRFDQTMEELVEILEPLSRRLEEIYSRESWMFESVEEEWREVFRKQHPVEFMKNFLKEGPPWNPDKELRIAVSLMYSNRMLYTNEQDVPFGLTYEYMYVGCGLPTVGLTRQQEADLDSIASTLKFLGDRKRLEILQRLNQEPSYGQELADSLGMDSGNMSRTLSQLYNRGFLRQEREDTRVYYQTDRESLESFLRIVETMILQKK